MLASGELCNPCWHLSRCLCSHQSVSCSFWLHGLSRSPDPFSANFPALLLFYFATCRWTAKDSWAVSPLGPGSSAAIHSLLHHRGRRSFGQAAAREFQTGRLHKPLVPGTPQDMSFLGALPEQRWQSRLLYLLV